MKIGIEDAIAVVGDMFDCEIERTTGSAEGEGKVGI